MTAENKSKGFVFYKDWAEIIGAVGDYEQIGRLMSAVFDYVTTGKHTELEGALMIAYSFIVRQIDRDSEKYEKVCDARSKAGKKSAEARRKRRSAEQEPNKNEQNPTNPTNTNKNTKTNKKTNINKNININKKIPILFRIAKPINSPKSNSKLSTSPTLSNTSLFLLFK